MQDALLSRLEVKTSNVKLKALRLLKFLCERGSPNFKRDLTRRTHIVRDCLHWRADPHPTMGDLPNKMVREAAQEAINAIFDTEMNQQPPVAPVHQPPSTVSVASSARVAAPATSAAASRPPLVEKSRYGGFGRENAPGGVEIPPDRSILSYASQHPSSVSSSGASRSGGFGTVQGQAPVAASGGIDSVYQAGAKASSMLRCVEKQEPARLCLPTPALCFTCAHLNFFSFYI